MKRIVVTLILALLLLSGVANAQTSVFPKADALIILETTRVECSRQWGNAHRAGHPERYDFIIEAVKRLYVASGGAIGGNWRRVVIGDLSMDGLTVDMREPNGMVQRYFVDVIVGAGGTNPRITWNVTGLLRDSAGRYAPQGFAAPNHPQFPAAVVGCGGTPVIPPPSPPPPPVVIPPYPGDAFFITSIGAVLEADYREAGQTLNAGSATWFARVIWDHVVNKLSIEQAIAKQRAEWRRALGLTTPAAEVSSYPLLRSSALCWGPKKEWIICH